MTPALDRLHRLRRERAMHLAALVDGGADGALARYHKRRAAKLALEIKRLEAEVKREGARNNG